MELIKNEQDELSEFLEKLTNRLIKQNEHLKESCANSNSEIERMHLQKAALFAEICTNGPPTSVLYIMQFITDNTSWLQVLDDGISRINQKMQMYREEYSSWRKTVKLEVQARLGTDVFTMMPFHEVEAEILQLKQQTAKYLENIQAVIGKGKDACISFEEQFMEIQQDVHTLEPFEKEIRLERETLMRKLCDLQHNSLPGSNSNFIGLESLRSEITALEAKLAGMQQSKSI